MDREAHPQTRRVHGRRRERDRHLPRPHVVELVTLAGGARQYREDPRHTRTRTIDWLVGDATALSLVTSEGTFARHDAFRMMQALHPMGLGADEYRFALDAQQGVLLRSEARRANRPFLVLEMTEVRFDEHFDADMFAPESLSM